MANRGARSESNGAAPRALLLPFLPCQRALAARLTTPSMP